MSKKRHTPEQVISKLREAEVELDRNKDVSMRFREASVTPYPAGVVYFLRPRADSRAAACDRDRCPAGNAWRRI